MYSLWKGEKMSEVETFVKIEGFEKYEVSNLGKVRNIKSGRILKPFPNRGGYLRHKLYGYDKKKNLPLHRIIATAFIDNPDEKPCEIFPYRIAERKCNAVCFRSCRCTESPWNPCKICGRILYFGIRSQEQPE